MELNMDSKVSHAPDQVYSYMDGLVVMLSVENGEYYQMDETGSAIWELIKEPISISDLINKLMTTYDVTKEECTVDVMEFLNHVGKDNLIKVV